MNMDERAPMEPNATDTPDPLAERLRALARERPDLVDAAAVYRVVLPLIRDALLRPGRLPLTADEARLRLEKGMPLLADLELEQDSAGVRELVLRLAGSLEALDRKKPETGTGGGAPSEHAARNGVAGIAAAARRIRLALEEKTLDFDALLPHVAAGEPGNVDLVARQLDLDPGLLLMLLRNGLRPAFSMWRQQAEELLGGTIRRDRGDCFVCGAGAVLGELRGDGQVLHLRCGECGADWQARRLRCLFCGNEDHRTLGCLFSEDRRERERVEACDRCLGYLKVVASFSPIPPELLPVEDLATLHLDFIARERGFTPSGTSRDY